MAQTIKRRSNRLSSSSSTASMGTSQLDSPSTSTLTTPASLFRAASEKLTAASKRVSPKSSTGSRPRKHGEPRANRAYPSTDATATPAITTSTSPTTNKTIGSKASDKAQGPAGIHPKNRKGGRQKKKDGGGDPVGNHSVHRRLTDRTRSSSSEDETRDGERARSNESAPSMIQLGFGEFMHVEDVELFHLDRHHRGSDTEDEEEAFERELEEERKLRLDTLYRDVGRILYLDIQAAQTLLSSLILILVQEGPMLDRSLPPEQQSEEAKARLEALAHSICDSVECVQRVSRSWPHVGIWLVTKAFDVWTGRL